jgi:hypothetical protein
VIPTRKLDLTLALQYYPFDGDETDVSGLSDKIVVAAKNHPKCQICDGPIVKGERHRVLTECNNEDHTVMSFRFCQKCCRAMASDDTYDTGRLIESRYSIGYRRRKGAPKRTAA